MENRLKAEVIAMIIFALGCVCDHLTTSYGLTLPNITEMNMNVAALIDHGIWHLVEIMIIMAGVASGWLALRSKSSTTLWLSTIALMSGGLIRLSAGIQNLTIIINAIT